LLIVKGRRVVLVRTSVSLAEMADAVSAPLAPKGVAAFSASGDLLVIEAEGFRVLMVNARDGVPVRAFETDGASIQAMAVRDAARQVAVGAPDGAIALYSTVTGQIAVRMAMNTQALTSLAFSPDGRLLAAGDAEGRVAVFWAASGEEARRIDTEEPICSIAIHDRGSPVLVGGNDGFVGVRRNSRARRRRVLGESLLHALLDVAFQAQVMASDSELGALPSLRAGLHEKVQQAARIASRQWVTGMRTGIKRTDRITRDQGHAVSEAIRRWERPAALAGAELATLSRAFTTAVVNAADCDWVALAGHATPTVSRRGRAWKVVGQILSLVFLLGTAAGIGFGIHPLPAALCSLLAFLVGLAAARILRWLDFDEDIDTGLSLSELLRKPSSGKE
jgi:hypothetical protein